MPFTAEIFKPTKTTKIKNNNKYVASTTPAEPSLKNPWKVGVATKTAKPHPLFQLSRDYYNTAFLVILLTAKVFIPSKNWLKYLFFKNNYWYTSAIWNEHNKHCLVNTGILWLLYFCISWKIINWSHSLTYFGISNFFVFLQKK